MGIEEILNLHTHWSIDTAPIIYKRLKNFSELTVIVLDDFLNQTSNA